MSIAGTPFSISVSEVQFTPELLVKNSVPEPLFGTPKLKFNPTLVQPCGGQCDIIANWLALAPRMMIFGSLIPSANAIADPTATSKNSAQIREIFIEVFPISQKKSGRIPTVQLSTSEKRLSCSKLRVKRKSAYPQKNSQAMQIFAHRPQKKPEPESPGCPVGCVPG
jgi:hypothetical protein